MRIFRYQVLGADGRMQSGEVLAPTRAHAQHHVRTIVGGAILSCVGCRNGWRWHKTFSRQDLVDLCTELAAHDQVGLPLVEALRCVSLTNSTQRKILEQIAQLVEEGLTFSQSLGRYHYIFPPILIVLVSSAEQIGSFHIHLHQAADYFRWQKDLCQHVHQALRYPTLLLICFVILMVVMMGVFVPNLQEHFQVLGVSTQPLATTALLHASAFCQTYGGELLGSFLVAFSLWSLAERLSTRMAMHFARLRTALPWVGRWSVHAQYVQFFYTLSLLQKNGIPLLQALEHATNSLTNPWVFHHTSLLKNKLKNGQTLSQACDVLPHLPVYMQRYIRLGERTGQVSTVLQEACQQEFIRLKRTLTAFTQGLQPALIVVMGALLIWVVMAIILPLYDTFSTIDF